MKYIKLFEYKDISQLSKVGDIFKLNVNSTKTFIVEVLEITKYGLTKNYSINLNIILTYNFKRNRWMKFTDKSSKITCLATFIDEHGKYLTEQDLIEFGDLLDDYKLQKDAKKYNL
jgi:hypothetical protein